MSCSTVDRTRRRKLGAFYTPTPIAGAVVRRAVDVLGRTPGSILDPACGDGAFLAACEDLGALLTGVDVDPAAIAASRRRLGPGVELLTGDALDPGVLADRRFDLIVGNPPFGLRRDDAGIWGLEVNRTDSYAAFLAMGLARLAPGGVLAFITADTWLSIRSHLALRRLLLPFLHEVALLPGGAFDATVHTCLVILKADGNAGVVKVGRFWPSWLPGSQTTTVGPANAMPASGAPTQAPNQGPELATARSAPATARIRIGADEPIPARRVPESEACRPIAVEAIAALPSCTIFVGDPGLAAIVAGGSAKLEPIGPGHAAPVRTLSRHGRTVRLVRLGDIARTPHGISTGANDRYIRVVPGTRGPYRPLEPGMIAPPDVLAAITDREREHGLPVRNADWKRGLGCHVPFDKGGVAEPADGWLPNYYVKTPYYINWAAGALEDMRLNKGFSWKNWRYFFRPGLTFSVSGLYAPTFRLGAGGVFEAKSSGLFCEVLPPELLLGILCSRTARYLFKVFIKHSVDTSGADVAAFPLVLPPPDATELIVDRVRAIVRQQRADPRYPYQHREQVELDRVVADCYGLDAGEIAAVDSWFAERYPRLAAALQPISSP